MQDNSPTDETPITNANWHPYMEDTAYAEGTQEDREIHMVEAQFKDHYENFHTLVDESMTFLEAAAEDLPLDVALGVHESLQEREGEMRIIVKTRIKTHLTNNAILFLPSEKGTNSPIEPAEAMVHHTIGEREGLRVVGAYLDNINRELDDILQMIKDPSNQTTSVLRTKTWTYFPNTMLQGTLEELNKTMTIYKEEFYGDTQIGG